MGKNGPQIAAGATIPSIEAFQDEGEEEELQTLVERRFMTVCAAAFAEKSQAIVAVTDKSITYGTSLPMQSDTAIKKVISVGNSGWHVLIAGSPSFATAVVRETEKLMRTTQHKSCIRDAVSMMFCMEQAYKSCWERLAESNVLRRHLLTRPLWRERGKDLQPLSEKLLEKVNADLDKFNKQSNSLLVIGFDHRIPPSPHIFSIVGTGNPRNHDVEGFQAVGIGSPTAMGRMMFLEVDRDRTLERNLYDVFDAKAISEMVQGVGYASDVYVALPHDRDLVEIPKDIKELMDTVFTWEINSPFERINPDRKERPDKPDSKWVEKLNTYCNHLRKRRQKLK
jgi:hypothetical protein